VIDFRIFVCPKIIIDILSYVNVCSNANVIYYVTSAVRSILLYGISSSVRKMP